MLAHTVHDHKWGEAPSFISVVVIKYINVKQCGAKEGCFRVGYSPLEKSSWSHPQARAGTSAACTHPHCSAHSLSPHAVQDPNPGWVFPHRVTYQDSPSGQTHRPIWSPQSLRDTLRCSKTCQVDRYNSLLQWVTLTLYRRLVFAGYWNTSPGITTVGPLTKMDKTCLSKYIHETEVLVKMISHVPPGPTRDNYAT